MRGSPAQRYSVFGLRLSCDRALPLLPWSPGSADLVVTEDLHGGASLEPGTRVLHDVEDPGARPPRLRIAEGPAFTTIDYGDCRIRWQTGTERITYAAPAGDAEAPSAALTRMALPFIALRRRPSLLPLHGSAIAIAGRVWVFAGPSGAGKSTVARFLVARGARLVSDDLTLVDTASLRVVPGPPELRLWAAREEVPEATEHARVSGTGKGCFRVVDASVEAMEQPLAGILQMCNVPDSRETRIEQVTGTQALQSILANTFTFSAASSEERARRFRSATLLNAATPSYLCLYRKERSSLQAHIDRLWDFLARAPLDHSRDRA